MTCHSPNHHSLSNNLWKIQFFRETSNIKTLLCICTIRKKNRQTHKHRTKKERRYCVNNVAVNLFCAFIYLLRYFLVTCIDTFVLHTKHHRQCTCVVLFQIVCMNIYSFIPLLYYSNIHFVISFSNQRSYALNFEKFVCGCCL